MQGLSFLVRNILRIVIRIYKKFGLTILLGIFLFIEIIITIPVVLEMTGDYKYEQVYKVASIEKIEKVELSDPRLKGEKYLDEDALHYIATVRIENYDQEDLYFINLDACNQNGDNLICKKLDYYQNLYYTEDTKEDDYNLQYSYESVIPAGTAKDIQVLLMMRENIAKETTEITIFEWKTGNKKEKNENFSKTAFSYK